VIEIRVLVLQPLSSMRALHLDGRRPKAEGRDGRRVEGGDGKKRDRGEMKINDEIDIINLILT
jgi:hypothetical protein